MAGVKLIFTADKPRIRADKSDQNWSHCWSWRRSSLKPGPPPAGGDGGEGHSAWWHHWALLGALRCPGGGWAQSEAPEQDGEWSSVFLEWYFQHVSCNTHLSFFLKFSTTLYLFWVLHLELDAAQCGICVIQVAMSFIFLFISVKFPKAAVRFCLRFGTKDKKLGNPMLSWASL